MLAVNTTFSGHGMPYPDLNSIPGSQDTRVPTNLLPALLPPTFVDPDHRSAHKMRSTFNGLPGNYGESFLQHGSLSHLPLRPEYVDGQGLYPPGLCSSGLACRDIGKRVSGQRFMESSKNFGVMQGESSTQYAQFFQPLPPFSMFETVVKKRNNALGFLKAASLQNVCAGMKKTKTFKVKALKGGRVSCKTDKVKHKEQLHVEGKSLNSEKHYGKDIIQTALLKSRDDKPSAKYHTNPAIVKTSSEDANKPLRHSIASILNISPSDNGETSFEQENKKDQLVGEGAPVCDQKHGYESECEVDVTSCGVDGKEIVDVIKQERESDGSSCKPELPDDHCPSEGVGSPTAHKLKKCVDTPIPDSYSSSDSESSINPDCEVGDADIETDLKIKTPEDRESEHLKKLECFINNTEANHFNKAGDYFAPVIGFLSPKNEHDEGVYTGNKLYKHTSKSPVLGNSSSSCKDASSAQRLPPIQTLCASQLQQHQVIYDQRSAFKPIVKPWIFPSVENVMAPFLNRCPVDGAVRQSNHEPIPSPEAHNDAESETPQASHKVSGLPEEDMSQMDAISMLRHRSSVYQTHHVTENVPPPTTEPLPSSLGAWLTWLRRRNVSSSSHVSRQGPASHQAPPRAPPPPRYHCDACNKTYSTFGGLSKHRQFHCAQHVRKEFACKVCSKAYSSLGALKMHIRTHTLPCKCHVCGKAFSRPWLLQGHVRTHTGEKPFRCSHCGRAFADRSNLRAHLQTHADVKKYACTKCGKTFSRMSLLNKHSEGSCPRN